MKYELQDIKPSNGAKVQKAVLQNTAKQLSTPQLLWIIAQRHKFGIVSTIAILLAVQLIFPPFIDIVRSII